MSIDNQLITLENLILVHSTAKAYLIRSILNQETAWIPKSQTKNMILGVDLIDENSQLTVKEIVSIEMPEWLAIKNNLL